MSITFWCPDAPKTVRRMEDGEGDFALEVSTLPEIQMGNGRAFHLLMLLNIERDHCGTIPLAELGKLEETIGTMLGNLHLYFDPGSDYHLYYTLRLLAFHKLVVLARAGGYSITWG